MKKWTISITFEQGSDEFWEAHPTPEDVANLVTEIMWEGGLSVTATPIKSEEFYVENIK